MTTRQNGKGREQALNEALDSLGTSIDEVAAAINSAMPALDKTDQQIATAVHRLISRGEPVEPAAIAKAVGGVSLDRVNERLNAWPGVFRDDEGRVVGFWGQAVEKLDPEYRLLTDGTTTYAWCALDTLFIPGVIGKTVRVEASDPITAEPVSLVVDGDGVRDVTPAGAFVSMLVPEGPFAYDVIESFCHFVLFFASRASGEKWVAEHEGTTLVSVEKAFELGRLLTERITPAVYGAETGTR